MNYDVIIPKGEYKELKKFEGTPFNSLIAMAYLNKKHKNHCVIIPIRDIPDDHTDLSIRWIQKKGQDGYLRVPKKFWTEFKEHLNHSHDKRFIVFPFGFSCKKNGGHANIMIYDVQNKILERFDSLGNANSNCLKVKNLDQKIKKLFQDEMGHNFVKKYLKPFNNFKIFQELQDLEDVKKLPTDPEYGFCSVWACWWSDLRMSNPHISRDDLVEISLELLLEKNKSLTSFIRKYSQNIVNHMDSVNRYLNKIKRNKSRSKSRRNTNLKQYL